MHFASPQGLIAHRRMLHGFVDRGVPAPEMRVEQVSAKDTIKNLEDEVAQLKLQGEKRRLVAGLPSTESGPPDLMQQLGLGAFDSDVKAAAQRRAMSLADSAQGHTQSWLDKLLSSPGGVQTAVDGLKGVLGVGHNNEGSGLGVLKDLGIDLKSLLEHSQAPKADSSFKVAGLSLDGCSLTPELLSSLVQFKAAEDNLAYQKSKDATLADGMNTIIKLVSDSGLLNRLGGAIANGSLGKRGAGRDISQDINPRSTELGVEEIFNCPLCGYENKLPIDISPGVEIHCQSPDCGQSFMIESQAQQPKAGKQRREVKFVEPELPTVNCPSCGQLLDITNKGIAETVICPACQESWTITSENTAIKAQAPLTELEKQSQGFLR